MSLTWLTSSRARQLESMLAWFNGQPQLTLRGPRRLKTKHNNTVERWFGRVVETGPDGNEPDYEDNRYWVEQLELDATAMGQTQQTPAPDDALLVFKPLETPVIVTAHLLEEHGLGASGNGLHAINKDVGSLLAPTRYCWVEGLATSAGTRYFIQTYPGQMFNNYGFDVQGCVNGCPVGAYVKTTGPAVTALGGPNGC